MTGDDTGPDFIVWAHDQTPTIDCYACGVALIQDDNGNAPLVFSMEQLVAAVSEHDCDPGRRRERT